MRHLLGFALRNARSSPNCFTQGATSQFSEMTCTLWEQICASLARHSPKWDYSLPGLAGPPHRSDPRKSLSLRDVSKWQACASPLSPRPASTITSTHFGSRSATLLLDHTGRDDPTHCWR